MRCDHKACELIPSSQLLSDIGNIQALLPSLAGPWHLLLQAVLAAASHRPGRASGRQQRWWPCSTGDRRRRPAVVRAHPGPLASTQCCFGCNEQAGRQARAGRGCFWRQRSQPVPSLGRSPKGICAAGCLHDGPGQVLSTGERPASGHKRTQRRGTARPSPAGRASELLGGPGPRPARPLRCHTHVDSMGCASSKESPAAPGGSGAKVGPHPAAPAGSAAGPPLAAVSGAAWGPLCSGGQPRLASRSGHVSLPASLQPAGGSSGSKSGSGNVPGTVLGKALNVSRWGGARGRCRRRRRSRRSLRACAPAKTALRPCLPATLLPGCLLPLLALVGSELAQLAARLQGVPPSLLAVAPRRAGGARPPLLPPAC